MFRVNSESDKVSKGNGHSSGSKMIMDVLENMLADPIANLDLELDQERSKETETIKANKREESNISTPSPLDDNSSSAFKFFPSEGDSKKTELGNYFHVRRS